MHDTFVSETLAEEFNCVAEEQNGHKIGSTEFSPFNKKFVHIVIRKCFHIVLLW